MECHTELKDIVYYPSGTIKSYVVLGENQVQIHGQYVRVAANSKVCFYPNGQIKSAVMAEETLLCLGGIFKKIQENELLEISREELLLSNSEGPFKLELGLSPIPFLLILLKTFGME